jgi:hypothetical protein
LEACALAVQRDMLSELVEHVSMGVESPVIMGLQFSLPDGREWVR